MMIFSKPLISWYLQHKRDLPWRNVNDPYKIWVSEIILQQTRIDQGLPYYNRFIKRFPDVFTLAEATEEEVLKLWQGLGYYSRARNLHFAAKQVVEEFKGVFPRDYDAVKSLKGVGDYTAAAIVSICYGLPYASVDGNVYRVLARHFGVNLPINTTKGKKYFAKLATKLLFKPDPGNYNQAVMELGATVCIPKNPKCTVCPVNQSCVAYTERITEQLPVKEKRQKIKKRYFNYLVFDYQGTHTVLEQRRGKGIWQNLFQFPLIETEKPISDLRLIKKIEEKSSALGINPQDIAIRPFNNIPVIHKLSHQHLITSFWIISLHQKPADALSWEAVHKLAVPVLIHNFILKFKE